MNVKKIASVLLVLMLSVAFVFANGSKEASSSSSNTLKVAMECGYAPYNWTQTTDANGAVKISGSTEYAYGYDVMMAKLIAEKLGKDLATIDELAVLDGGKCILQLRGVRPFMSNKFDITKHPQYKYLSDANPKNNFDIEKFLSTQLKTKPDDVYEVFEVDASDVSATA